MGLQKTSQEISRAYVSWEEAKKHLLLQAQKKKEKDLSIQNLPQKFNQMDDHQFQMLNRLQNPFPNSLGIKEQKKEQNEKIDKFRDEKSFATTYLKSALGSAAMFALYKC